MLARQRHAENCASLGSGPEPLHVVPSDGDASVHPTSTSLGRTASVAVTLSAAGTVTAVMIVLPRKARAVTEQSGAGQVRRHTYPRLLPLVPLILFISTGGSVAARAVRAWGARHLWGFAKFANAPTRLVRCCSASATTSSVFRTRTLLD